MRATNTSHAHACMYLCRCQATAAWQCTDQPICLSIDADIILHLNTTLNMSNAQRLVNQ
jgi:hypothetical protein